MLYILWSLAPPARGQAWAPRVGAPSPGLWTTRDFPAPRNIYYHELSQRSPSWHQSLAPPNILQAPVLDASDKTTSKTGAQLHPSADRWPKVLLSSQTLQNTLPDVALQIKGTRLSSIHESTDTSIFHLV